MSTSKPRAKSKSRTTPSSSPRPDLARVRALAARRHKRIIKCLRDLVALYSPSGKEGAVCERIAQEMRNCGFDEVKFDRLGNVLGRMGSGRTVLLYDGHIDTVEIGDRKAWPHDPLRPPMKDGKLFGRGVVDEKACIPPMIHAVAIAKELALLDGVTLWVCGSVMEEDCDGLCMLHLIEKEKLRPDYVVLGEPTDLNIKRGHRGRMEMKVTIKGKSAHGAHQERGINAATKAARLALDIDRLNKRLRKDRFLGKGSICVTKVDSYTNSLNCIPHQVDLYLDRRLTAGETKDSALAEVRALPSFADSTIEVLHYEAVSWRGYKAGQEKYYPTWVLDEDHPLVQAAVKAATLANGRKPKVTKWDFSTNGVATMGHHKIPTIGYAPGLEELAHTTDEWIAEQDLLTACVFYALLPPELLATRIPQH